jgi:hypothetical protein
MACARALTRFAIRSFSTMHTEPIQSQPARPPAAPPLMTTQAPARLRWTARVRAHGDGCSGERILRVLRASLAAEDLA